MEKNPFDLTPLQLQELQSVVSLLTSRYHPDKLICFGSLHQSSEAKSCFITAENEYSSHYFLLMVTKEAARIEHDVQDYVTTHFSAATITIISHGRETIEEAIAKSSRFFITVYRQGYLLYSADGMPLCFKQQALPAIDPVVNLRKARKHYNERWNMASGFLAAAEACWEPGYFNTVTFLLHQAVEQTCNCLIRVFMAYRADIHNLDRLIKLCLCCYPELARHFPGDKEEERRLFKLLNASYSHARYKDDFEVSCDDADALINMVDDFMTMAEALCLNKIAAYEQAANDAAAQLADYSPALNASIMAE